MAKYKITDIVFGMAPLYPTLQKQSAAYLYDGDEEIRGTIEFPRESIEKCVAKNPHLSFDEAEYICTGIIFYNYLLKCGGMMLHSSAVEYNGYAYLFSAPSGTGKSTHAKLWLKNFPGARIINDDKPALRFFGDKLYACGTPWSGKTDLNINTCVPVGGICFISRDENNHIERADTEFMLKNLLEQTVRPANEKAMDAVLNFIEKIMKTTPVYKLGCNMDIQAAQVSYDAMKRD